MNLALVNISSYPGYISIFTWLKKFHATEIQVFEDHVQFGLLNGVACGVKPSAIGITGFDHLFTLHPFDGAYVVGVMSIATARALRLAIHSQMKGE